MLGIIPLLTLAILLLALANSLQSTFELLQEVQIVDVIIFVLFPYFFEVKIDSFSFLN